MAELLPVLRCVVIKGLLGFATALLLLVTSLTQAAETASVQDQVVLASGTSPSPTVHSSDGVRGPILSDLPQRRSRLGALETDEVGWTVAPGLEYSRFTRSEQQGPVQVHVLTARLDEPGLVLDQVSGTAIRSRAPLTQWLRADDAVAGVNADFFDINDTGAPLGVGADRQRHLLHSPRSGWNNAFLIDSAGTARVMADPFYGRVVPRVGNSRTITNFNSPVVAPNGIGLYTSAWGRTAGRSVVNGARRVRQVVIRDGVVRSNSIRLSSGSTITGSVLVGRGDGAGRLRDLRVGRRVRIEKALGTGARMAVGGSVQLIRSRTVLTKDNGELHPRTAIGIDRDLRLLHLVVVDGRSESSSGQTLLQLANLLRSLGDDAAINLDGGGSSTMVAKDPVGVLGVRNSPSDGSPRKVPNGLGFRYTPPPG
jgi:Phosphodiester glycosidase